MKIAIFGHKRIPSREGGVEIVTEHLASRVAALGHSVTCYNRGGHHVSGAQYDTETQKEYKGIRMKTVLTWDKKGLAAVTASISAAISASFSKAKVVHIHAEGPAFMCWLPRLMGKRVIVTVHGLDWQREKWKSGFGSRYIRAGERMAVRYAHEIIVLSRNVQNYFLQTYGREVRFIPNGIARPQLAPEEVITPLGLEKDGFILFLGRLVPEKGIHHLIQAFRDVKTDKKLVIAGGSSDSREYADSLKALAEGDDRILFTGFVQGGVLSGLYSNSYLYVLPSAVEGMPLSLLEAMSYGNCCVVSDIPECTEVVEEHAAVFPNGDVDALRQTLQTLCDDKAVVESYRKSAADYICEKYNWDDITKRTLELYE